MAIKSPMRKYMLFVPCCAKILESNECLVTNIHSPINSLNVFINEVVVTRTFKDFDQLQIRSPLFSQVLKRPRFRSWRRRRVWTV